MFRMRLVSGIALILFATLPRLAFAWADYGGNFSTAYAPTGTHHVDNGVAKDEIYAINANGSVSVGTMTESGANLNFSGWTNLGGVVITPPTAIYWTGHREVFVVGTDNKLYHNQSNDGSTWSGWYWFNIPNNPQLCSSPSAVSWAAGRVDVFATGCDNALHHLWWNGSSWNWESAPGTISSYPVATSTAANRLDVFAMDFNHVLWDRSWNGSSWSWIESSTSGYYPTAAVAPTTSGAPYFAVQSASSAGQMICGEFWAPSTWLTPATYSSRSSSAVPAAVAVQSKIDVYYKDASNVVWREECDTSNQNSTYWRDPSQNTTDTAMAGQIGTVSTPLGPLVMSVGYNGHFYLIRDLIY